jgi:FLVCR family MFS transporter 7
MIPSLWILFKDLEFYMILVPFAILVGFFNSISSLLNQILEPYNFTEEEAGIAGAILIVVGLVTAAITSPLIDRSKAFLLAIKLQVPVISLCYLVFIWAPPTASIPAVYTILAILGAASFSLVPVALEFLIEITHPISPELTSTICWTGGQLLGGIFILVSDALRDGPNGGAGGSAPFNMQRALWFQAAVALAVVPLPLSLGLFGRRAMVRMRRIEEDKAASQTSSSVICDPENPHAAEV